MVKSWVLLIISALINASANIFIKLGTKESKSIKIFLNPLVILGLFLFGCSFITYTIALRKLELSIAYPVMIGLGFIIISLFSFLILKENASIERIFGILLIFAGIMLLT